MARAPTTAAEHQSCCTAVGIVYVCINMCGLRMCADYSTSPFYLTVSGLLVGEEGCGRRTGAATAQLSSSTFCVGNCSGGGFGRKDYSNSCSCWTCLLSEECSVPSQSRVVRLMLCGLLCLTLAEKKQARKEVAFHRADKLGWSCIRGAPAATERHFCC